MAPRRSRRKSFASIKIAAPAAKKATSPAARTDGDEADRDEPPAVMHSIFSERQATPPEEVLKREQTCYEEEEVLQGEQTTEAEDEGKCWELEESTDSDSAGSVSSAPTSCSAITLDTMADYYSREETIIIFDWDDTLCPTTMMNAALARASSAEVEDNVVEEEASDAALQELVAEARKTLETAREMAAEVVIVTNATSGWIESSCESWLPGLSPALELLQVESARSSWEPTGISTPTGWKAASFEQLVRKFYSRYWNQSWKNIIVIGDACYEHEALSCVAALAPQGPTKRCRAKSIRFVPQPTVGLLACELRALRESFLDIVYHDDSLDVQLVTESL